MSAKFRLSSFLINKVLDIRTYLLLLLVMLLHVHQLLHLHSLLLMFLMVVLNTGAHSIIIPKHLGFRKQN